MASFTKVLKVSLLLLLAACTGMEQSEQEQIRRSNARGEFVYRNADEIAYPLEVPKHRVRERYPWEKASSSHHPKITKEFFRCKGSSLNPPHVDHKDPARPANYLDCGGFQKHSLPIQGDKEFIYPILIDLLNYLQDKTGAKVVITCGYRCPAHNAYADPSPYNQNSKHMIGAEVDFYVQGWEQKPEAVVQLLIEYYKEMKEKGYREFVRLEPKNLNVSTPPWYNHEILIKLYKKGEGRDFDNRHPYPYLAIQVRHDRDLGEKVVYSWQKAFNCYKRF
ncbi:MAG: DUF882 domain-containing protein [Verrucomicrobia bacterium]|nr:DUF882 domain-containing protein [Verrucomicrobiota bacterium]